MSRKMHAERDPENDFSSVTTPLILKDRLSQKTCLGRFRAVPESFEIEKQNGYNKNHRNDVDVDGAKMIPK